MKRLFLKAIVAAVALSAFGLAQAQTRTIKFANQNAKGHPIVLGMERFGELVEKKSGGHLKVQVFPGGTLGSDQANVSALQGGTLEMAAMNSGIFASLVKEFAIYDFPFLFGTPHEADAVVDGPFGQNLHRKLEDKGLVGLAYYELGFRELTNSKRPVKTVDDIAGLKLRVIPNPINIDSGSPARHVRHEGGAGRRDNTIRLIDIASRQEVAELRGHTDYVHAVAWSPDGTRLVSGSGDFMVRIWDSLAPADRKVLQEAATESAAYQRTQSRAQLQAGMEDLRKGGMQITELPPAEIAKLREKMKPVIAKHSATVGEDTVKAIQAELAKARK